MMICLMCLQPEHAIAAEAQANSTVGEESQLGSACCNNEDKQAAHPQVRQIPARCLTACIHVTGGIKGSAVGAQCHLLHM